MKPIFLALAFCFLVLPAGMTTIKAQVNAPVFIRSGTTADATTMKTITWMTDPTANPQAMMKIAKKSEGEGSFQQFTGKTMYFEYDTYYLGSGANPKIPKLACSVTVDGLEPGTAYIYQVGDGVDWSKTREFTTSVETNKYTFYVLGDLQAYAANTTSLVTGGTFWLRQIANTCQSIKPLFFIQVGDLVDREHVYNFYQLFGDVCNDYPVFANTDMVCAMGNHEYYRGINEANNNGEGRGEISKFLYGIPPMNNSVAVGSGTYSVDYGNMHVITLDFAGRGVSGYTANQIINAHAEWLRQDLQNCNKRWKVVNIHYPVYYQGDGYEQPYPALATVLGPIFDEFGVNVVFQGHVHTTRRVQVKNGVRQQPEGMTFQGGVSQISTATNGTAYITCGNLADNTEASIYIRGEVDGATMRLTVTTQSGNIRDNLTITQTVPVASITVSGADGATEITEHGGKLQMQALVLPEDANNRTVTWSVTPAKGVATISTTGLLTATGNGTVTVRARSNDGYAKIGEATIAVSGQRIAVSSVTVAGADGKTTITEKGGALQMATTILPDNATDKTVTWSVNPATGVANISKDGLLTAENNGTIIVRATANDGSGKYGVATITISGQTITGAESVFASNLNIYPNPFADAVRILGAEGCTLHVIDAKGAIVHVEKITDADEVIRLEQLSPGVYFFSIEKDGQTKTIKVVKVLK